MFWFFFFRYLLCVVVSIVVGYFAIAGFYWLCNHVTIFSKKNTRKTIHSQRFHSFTFFIWCYFCECTLSTKRVICSHSNHKFSHTEAFIHSASEWFWYFVCLLATLHRFFFYYFVIQSNQTHVIIELFASLSLYYIVWWNVCNIIVYFYVSHIWYVLECKFSIIRLNWQKTTCLEMNNHLNFFKSHIYALFPSCTYEYDT